MDANTILKGRTIIDAYRAELAKPTHPDNSAKLLLDIQALGFNDISDFYKANNDFVKADAKKCITLSGSCDYCVGRTPSCEKACFVSRSKPSPISKTIVFGDVTGRTPLNPTFDADILAMIRIFRTFFVAQSGGKRAKGQTTPIMPNCAIKANFINDPSIDWDWS